MRAIGESALPRLQVSRVRSDKIAPMGTRRRRSSKTPRRLLIGGIVAIAAIASVSLAAFAVAKSRETPDVSSAPRYVASTPPPSRPEVTAYFIGDSVTDGAGSGEGVEGSMATIAKRHLSWRATIDGVGASGFINKGFKARTDPNIDERFITRLPAIVDAAPDVLVIAGGRNDNVDTPGQLETAVDDFVEGVRSELPDTRIVFVTSWLWDLPEEEFAIQRINAVDEVIRAAAEEIDAPVIDSRTELLRITEENADEYLSDDDWHPNAAGHERMGNDLARALVEHGLPRGPELWKETAFNSGTYVDLKDEHFE